MIDDVVAATGVEVDVAEHLVAPVAHAELGDLERDGSRARRHRQLELARPLPLVDPGPCRLHPFDPLVELLRLARPLLRAGPHGVGQGAEALDLALLELGGALALGQVRLVLGLELGVVALPLGEALVRDVQHLGDGVVQQLEVVAHDEERAGEAGQLVEQPPLGRAVEMVRRLVEDHQLGLLEQDAHQVDPAALAARQLVDVLEEELLSQAQAVGETRHDRLGLVAAARLELVLEVGEQLDVRFAGIVGQRLACCVEGLVEDVEPAGREDVGEAGGLEPQPSGHGSLGQVAEGAEQPHVAPVAQLGAGLAHQHRDEGRLAGPVAAHQADLLPLPHHEGRVGEEGAVADFDA